MGVRARGSFEFGSYRVDTARSLLLRNGDPVSLTHKAFQTLLILVERGQDGISKDELMKVLWPNTFVEESNLTKHISMVRKALGETAQDHRYIVTEPGRGYRFAEAVRWVPESSGNLVLEKRSLEDVIVGEAESRTGSSLASKVNNRFWRIAVLVASLLGLVWAGAQLVRQPDKARPTRAVQLAQASSGPPATGRLAQSVSAGLPSTHQMRDANQLQAAVTSGSVTPTAVEYCLKAQYFWNRRDRNGLVKAIEYFQRAADADPNYPAPYAGLAQSWVLLGDAAHAKSAADKALSLDPNIAEAHTALALIHEENWDFSDAEREYRLAISLNPDYATAHHWYSEGFLALMGRFEEADAEMKRARALDPVSLIIATDEGALLYFQRRYDEAYEELSKVLEMEPSFSEARMFRGATLVQQGRYGEGIADLQESAGSGNEPRKLGVLGWALASAGKRSEASAILHRLKIISRARTVPPWSFAVIHIGLGDTDEAFAFLEKAYAERSGDLRALKVEPLYDPLRSDPRFQDLQRRVGLVE